MVIRPGLSSIVTIVAAMGSIELATARLMEMSRETEEMETLDEEGATDLASLGAAALIASAPAVLQSSFTHCCHYHNLRDIHEGSMNRNDLRTALTAQTEMIKLIGGVG